MEELSSRINKPKFVPVDNETLVGYAEVVF